MSASPHSRHDVEHLLERWDRLARRHGWAKTILGEECGLPIVAFEGGSSNPFAQFYVSAGVHGDECASIWALLEWAEAGGAGGEARYVILPCLNPVGIRENTRTNGAGVDLNRRFQDRDIDLIREWQDFLEDRSFDVALNLHEDYDAQGIYLYEVARENPCGERILAACESIIPREIAETVDGSLFCNGLLSHGEDVASVIENDLDGGWPEALYLYVNHTRDSYTFETPSEFAVEDRIAAHRRCLDTLFPWEARN